MLNCDKNSEYYRSSEDLLYDFYKKYFHKNLMKTNSTCVGSLVLESNFQTGLKKGILAVDMESSVILSSSKNKEKSRLFYVRYGFSRTGIYVRH
jgi:hypothetical protein